MTFMPSIPKVSFTWKVPQRYSRTHFNFLQSWLVLLETQVHKKAMASCMSGLPCLEMCSNLATMLWNLSLLVLLSLILQLLISKRSFFAGVGDDLLIPS